MWGVYWSLVVGLGGPLGLPGMFDGPKGPRVGFRALPSARTMRPVKCDSAPFFITPTPRNATLTT